MTIYLEKFSPQPIIHMNRRAFLSKALMLAAGSATVPGMHLFAGNGKEKLPADEYNQLNPLRRNTGTFTGRGGTIGWLADNHGIIVIDSQFPPSARTFFTELQQHNSQSLLALINTHHHADHTAGNLYFSNIAEQIVAHENVPELQRTIAEEQNSVDEQVYPDTTFDTEWRLDTGDEIIHANYYGHAHTAGDIIIRFEKANVVHMGDLVFNRWYPFIDTDGGADISNWIEVLQSVADDADRDTFFIFGHGSSEFGITGSTNDLIVMRDYLSALLDFVDQRISDGNSLEEIASVGGLNGFPDHISPGARLSFQANVAAAWDELHQ